MGGGGSMAMVRTLEKAKCLRLGILRRNLCGCIYYVTLNNSTCVRTLVNTAMQLDMILAREVVIAGQLGLLSNKTILVAMLELLKSGH